MPYAPRGSNRNKPTTNHIHSIYEKALVIAEKKGINPDTLKDLHVLSCPE
jgi:hypothetical protein